MAEPKKSILGSFLAAYRIFPASFKMRYWLSLSFLFVNSIIELVGLAAIIPLFSIMLQEDFVQQNKYLLTFYNALGFSSESQFVIFICCLVIFVIILKNVISILILKFQTTFSFSLYTYFSTSLLEHFYRLGYLNFKKNNSNFIVSYVHSYPAWFAQFFVLPLLTLINEITVIVMLIIGIIFFNPEIVLLLLCTVFPVSSLIYMFVRRKIVGVGRKKAEYSALLHKNLHQAIEGFVDIKTLVKEKYFFGIYRKLVNENSRLNTRSNVLMAIPSKVIETGMILGMVCLVLAGMFILDDRAQLTTLLGLFAIAAYRIMPSVNRIMAALLSMKENQYTVDVISAIGVATPENEGKSRSAEAELEFKNKISLENICYRYQELEKNTLTDITIDINAGETIGIIGRSGSGKTTLINILLRFLKEDRGVIKVDGRVLEDRMVNSWRHLIGYVQQQVYIVDGSIAQNIAFGIPVKEIDEARLDYAIEAASLKEFVRNQPQGTKTKIGERGSQLSGGQRQRIGIARALYANARILLFDEATSSLDTTTETEITDSIKSLSDQHFTMIIIAHRYTTLRYCNKIIELNEGKIAKYMTYEELKAQST